MLLPDSAGNHLQLVISPLQGAKGTLARLRALVMLRDPQSKLTSRVHTLREAYQLTPTEARIADLLADGMDIVEIAERLHMSAGNARYHLKRVFGKTGTRRQAELVRLVTLMAGTP